LKELLLKARTITAAERVAEGAEPGIVERPAIAKLKQQIRQYADSPFPVLIEGESGSGKELVALSLHRQSPRAMKPYLALNCAAISPNLVEATLFGHTKGAFTGANTARAGYFEDARDAPVPDEIGELPLELKRSCCVYWRTEYQRGETQSRHTSKSDTNQPRSSPGGQGAAIPR
jgi:DNA-binding NtrC family response regulator